MAIERVMAADDASSIRLAAGAGLLFGFAVLTRETVLYLLPGADKDGPDTFRLYLGDWLAYEWRFDVVRLWEIDAQSAFESGRLAGAVRRQARPRERCRQRWIGAWRRSPMPNLLFQAIGAAWMALVVAAAAGFAIWVRWFYRGD